MATQISYTGRAAGHIGGTTCIKKIKMSRRIRIDQNKLLLKDILNSKISFTKSEFNGILERCSVQSFQKNEIICAQGILERNTYFLEKGLVRHCTTNNGKIHTTHFGIEGQFFGDYTAVITKQPTKYQLEALEESEIIIIPNDTLLWMYSNTAEGEKLARLIWDHFYLYLDERLHDIYTLNPLQRYDKMNKLFPNILQRVPQHMIASYIGISNIHLSRLKSPKS